MSREIRCDVVSSELLDQVLSSPLPRGIKSSAPVRSFFREIHLDTREDFLQRQGVRCSIRVAGDGSSMLSVEVGARSQIPGESHVYSARLPEPQLRAALASPTEPMRRVSAIVDPRRLETRVEVDVERHTRRGGRSWTGRRRIAVHFDRVKVRLGGSTRSFYQITLEQLHGGTDLVDALAKSYADERGLRVVTADTRERAELLMKWMVREQRSRPATGGVAALLLLRGSELGLVSSGAGLRIPAAAGSGIGVARQLLDEHAPNAAGDPRLLGTLSSIGEKSALEVWAAEAPLSGTESRNALSWIPIADAFRRISDSAAADVDSFGAIALGLRSGIVAKQATQTSDDTSAPETAIAGQNALQFASDLETPDARFLNSEISILEFNTRVLALAEDMKTPLRERLRFLSIVSANVDEFFMVRVAALKQLQLESVEETGQSALTPREQLELIAEHTNTLIARQYRCFEACMSEAAGHGVRIARWADLDASARQELREYFREEIFPGLTPLAMTLSAGHPFPKLAHLSLSLAVVLLDTRGGAPHFAHVELPAHLARFTPVPGSTAVIGTEELVRANLDLLYPGLRIEQAYLFRVTRGADITLDEDNAWSLLHAVDEASKRRYENPVVRVEVESPMPVVIRELVLKELQREHGFSLAATDTYEVPGLVDLRALDDLTIPNDPSLQYPKFSARDGFAAGADIWALIRERDRLVHHPFENFSTTVGRFFEEAASDPDVTAIKATLYRVGEDSPVVAALIAAAKAGKDVVVFVELKARFEEERNVGWAKKLQEAGGKMVFGFVGLKTHAKAALIVRRENGKYRRYAHVGTGNYNAETAKRYTDLSLFSANPEMSADVNDLFNELTGSSSAPQPLSRGCLIAPRQLLPALIERIEREAAHARAGRGGSIRMKLNGLSDPDVIGAFYRASKDGVRISLVVRGICTLRPGVVGMSETISVTSVVGGYLEHGRIYHFANGGNAEYFIGSPDLRPRNLRRRIELVAPVRDSQSRAELERILDLYEGDPGAWDLGAGGEYVRRTSSGKTAQELLLG